MPAGAPAAPDAVDLYARWEWRCPEAIDLAGRNPFDPAAVRVDVALAAPSGRRLLLPAFFDGRAFMARFTPDEPGVWEYRAEADTPEQTREWRGRMQVAPSGRRGFLRLVGGGLRHETGQPFVPIGCNLCWGEVPAYERWLTRLAAAGANFARLWMAPWCFALEWDDTPPGDYTARLHRADALDRVFDLAEERGIALQLCLLNHGQFSTAVNPEWHRNPWNAALPGGFLQRPEQVFTDARAEALLLRRLRYIVARWGYAPHLLAWELWNEVDLTDAYDSAAVAAWHAHAAAALRAVDPHRHLVTTSYARPAGDAAVWALPGLDFTCVHRYGFRDVPGQVAADVARQRAFGRPVLYGELGLDAGGPDRDRDPAGRYIRQGAWAALLAGAVGGALPWWWDNYVDPLDLYGSWTAVAAFARDAFAADPPGAFAPLRWTVEAGADALHVLALHGPEVAAAWIWDAACAAPSPERPDAVVRGGRLRLTDLPPGRWQVTWWDTRTGARSDGGAVQAVRPAAPAGGGAVQAVRPAAPAGGGEDLATAPVLELPPVRGDLAVVLRR